MSYIPPRPSSPPSNPPSSPKRSRKGLWIVLACLAGVALVAGGTVLGVTISQADDNAESSEESQAKPKPKKTTKESQSANDASQEKKDNLRNSELSKKRTPQRTSSPTPSQRYTQTSALCPSGMFVVGEGVTASFTVAVCSSADGKLTYNGASTTGGGDISLEAQATSVASWTAENPGTPPTVYIVTPERLFVSAGDAVYVDESMVSWKSY